MKGGLGGGREHLVNGCTSYLRSIRQARFVMRVNALPLYSLSLFYSEAFFEIGAAAKKINFEIDYKQC